MLLGAAVILYYTTVGGLKAVAYSDLLQGVLMLGCLVALPVVGIRAAGGWSVFTERLGAADPALLRPMGTYGPALEGIASAAGFAAIGLAFLGSPQLLTRFISARSRDDIVSGGLVAVVCIIGFDIGAVLSGMAGRVLLPGLGDPETILPEMAAALSPSVLTDLFLVVVPAAIMSTVDSLLILASSAVVKDVVQEIFRPGLSQRTLSTYGKATTVVIGLLALAMALTEARVIFWFVLFAWSGIACAFTPVVLCSLLWKGYDARGRGQRDDHRVRRHRALGHPLQGTILRSLRDAAGLLRGAGRHRGGEPDDLPSGGRRPGIGGGAGGGGPSLPGLGSAPVKAFRLPRPWAPLRPGASVKPTHPLPEEDRDDQAA